MILVHVSQKHINDSPKNDQVNGLLGNAIGDCFTQFVSVWIMDGRAILYTYNSTQDDYVEAQTAELPVIAQMNQDRFNAGIPIAPFSFYIDFYINS